MLRGTYHRLAETITKTEDAIKDVEKYSMMYQKKFRRCRRNKKNRTDKILKIS